MASGALAGFRGALARLLGLSTMPAQNMQGGGRMGPDEVLGGHLTPPVVSQTRWLLADLEEAIHYADQGDLKLAAKLCRAMNRDGSLAGVMSTRTDGLVRLPIKWSGRDDMVRELEGRDGKRGVFARMCPTAELALTARDGIELGAGIGEMLPIPRDPEDDAPQAYVYRRLEPEWLVYRWHEDRWYYNSLAGPLPIIPGVVRADGGWWVLHRPGGEVAPWANGLWPSLGHAYIEKEHAKLHRANYSAKLAQAARAAFSPAGATEDQRRGMLARLIAWGVNQAFDLPPGWDVKLIESNGRGYDVFQATIDTSNNEYVVAIAGQTVTTDGGTGFANAEIHKTIRADLIQSTADGLCLTVNEQILLPYTNLRWGAGALDTAPAFEWDTSPPKEMKAQADAMTSFGQGVAAVNAALQPYGHRVDIYELSTRYGIPLAGEKQPVVQPRESAPDDGDDTGAAAPVVMPAAPAAPKLARRTTRTGPRTEFHGLSIVVENPKGSIRTWHDEAGGETGSTLMHHDYGYVDGHRGNDGEDLDCYVGPDRAATHVYVVHQLAAPDFTRFDEDKVMLGFSSADDARRAYLAHRNDGDRAFGGMSTIELDAFVAKIGRRTGSGKIRAGKPQRASGELLAVAFDRDDWTVGEAKRWARSHGYESSDLRIHDNLILVAQGDAELDVARARRVDAGDGVELLVAAARRAA